jgi:TnpA family transposase
MPIALALLFLLCALRYPGQALSAVERPPDSFLAMVAGQLGIDERVWAQYAEREETRREHLSELRAFLTDENDSDEILTQGK